MNSGYGPSITRRRVLVGAAVGAAAVSLPKPFAGARAAESIVVRDPGGICRRPPPKPSLNLY
jgi:hypothetical protein